MNPRDAYLLQAQDGQPPAQPPDSTSQAEAQALAALDSHLSALLRDANADATRIMALVRAQAQRQPRPSSRIMAQVRRQPRPRRRSRSALRLALPFGLAAAAVLIAAIALTWPQRPGSDPQPRLLVGELSAALAPGAEVQALSDVRFDDGRGAQLALTRGSRLRLADHSTAAYLLAGKVAVEVEVERESSAQPWILDTAHLRVEVLGTAFRVQTDEDSSTVAVERGRVAVQQGAEQHLLSAGQQQRVWDSARLTWQQPAESLVDNLRRGRWEAGEGLRPQHQLQDERLHRWDLIWQHSPGQRIAPLLGQVNLDLELALSGNLQLVLSLHDPVDGSFVSNLILTWNAQPTAGLTSLNLSNQSRRRLSQPDSDLDRLLEIRRAHLTAYSMPDPGLRLRGWGWTAP